MLVGPSTNYEGPFLGRSEWLDCASMPETDIKLSVPYNQPVDDIVALWSWWRSFSLRVWLHRLKRASMWCSDGVFIS